MKVLIVAEQLDIQDYLRQLNPAVNYFQYTHPLKAMDNLEEISPSLILWNADDFPRHWKTFLPFCRALFPKDMPQFHLISEGPLSDEEQGKAETLELDGIHTQGFFTEELSDLLVEEGSAVALGTTARQHAAIPEGSGSIHIQHPLLRRLFIGDVLENDQNSLRVRFHGEELTGNFKLNMIIEHAFFRIKETTTEVMLRLSAVNSDATFNFLILQFYELQLPAAIDTKVDLR